MNQSLGGLYFPLSSHFSGNDADVRVVLSWKSNPFAPDISEFVKGRSINYTPHIHAFYELVVVLEGSGWHCLEGEEYFFSAGDLFVIPPEKVHCYRELSKDIRFINIMYHDMSLREYIDDLKEIDGFRALFSLEPKFRHQHGFQSRFQLSQKKLLEVQQVMLKMHDEEATRSPGFKSVLKTTLVDLMVNLSRSFENNENNELQRKLLTFSSMQRKISQNLKKKWSVAEMAELACMSPATLQRHFHRVEGCSALDYVLRLRIKYASKLLRETRLNMSEIAYKSGFFDSNYFSRIFKQNTGKTPSSFRKRYLNR